MAYYDALIAAWNSSGLPPGVTGTVLTSTMTTDQKLTTFNNWTVVGSPRPMIIPTYMIYNVIVGSEFAALSSNGQQFIRDILGLGAVDGSPGTQVRARIASIFPSSTATFAALQNLAVEYDAPQVPWWSMNGYPARISGQDLVNAGLH